METHVTFVLDETGSMDRMNEDDSPFGDQLPMADAGTELTMAEFRAFWECLHSATNRYPPQRPALVIHPRGVPYLEALGIEVDEVV